MFVTSTSGGLSPEYAGSRLTAAPVTIENTMLPSETVSLIPVTVTVCGMNQSAGVNVTLVGCTVPSVVSLLVNDTVTFAIGAVLSTMVNVSVSWNSETSTPVSGSIVKPAMSSSVFVTVTSAGSSPA